MLSNCALTHKLTDWTGFADRNVGGVDGPRLLELVQPIQALSERPATIKSFFQPVVNQFTSSITGSTIVLGLVLAFN